ASESRQPLVEPRARERVERAAEVVGVAGGELDALTGGWMHEPQPYRVEPLARETEPLGEGRVRTVHRVAHARVPLRRQVHADLVGSARLDVHLDEGGVRERLERLVVRDGALAVGDDRELPLRTRVPADGRVDRADERIEPTLDDGVVHLVDLA